MRFKIEDIERAIKYFKGKDIAQVFVASCSGKEMWFSWHHYFAERVVISEEGEGYEDPYLYREERVKLED